MALSVTQGGVDRIKGILGNSLHGNLFEEKPPNNPTSCPTCPDGIDTRGVANVCAKQMRWVF